MTAVTQFHQIDCEEIQRQLEFVSRTFYTYESDNCSKQSSVENNLFLFIKIK